MDGDIEQYTQLVPSSQPTDNIEQNASFFLPLSSQSAAIC